MGGGTKVVSGQATDSEPELLPTETASTIVDRRIWADLRWLHLHAAQQNNNSAPAIAEDNAMALNSRGEKPAPRGPGVPVLELVAADAMLGQQTVTCKILGNLSTCTEATGTCTLIYILHAYKDYAT